MLAEFARILSNYSNVYAAKVTPRIAEVYALLQSPDFMPVSIREWTLGTFDCVHESCGFLVSLTMQSLNDIVQYYLLFDTLRCFQSKKIFDEFNVSPCLH